MFVNEYPAGARDHAHTAITLSPGRTWHNYEILIESYAVHPLLRISGPLLQGEQRCQSCQQRRWRWGDTFGIWEEEFTSCFLM